MRLAVLHGAGRDEIRGASASAAAAGGSSSSSNFTQRHQPWRQHDDEPEEQQPEREAGGGPRELALLLLRRAEELQPRLAHRQVANIVWAAGRLGAAPPPQQLRRLLACCGRPGAGWEGFNSQELTNLAYGLALLRPLYISGADAAGADGCGSSSGSGSSSSSTGDAAGGQSQPGPLPWDDVFILGLFDAAKSSLPRFNARDAAQAAYSLALLRPRAPAGWLAAWSARAAALLPEMGGQGIANSAYAVARLALGGDDDAGSSGSSGGSSLVVYSSSDVGSSSGAGDAPDPLPDDLAAVQSWTGLALQHAALHAPTLSARELVGQILWAAGRLGEAAAPPGAPGALRALVERATELVVAGEGDARSGRRWEFDGDYDGSSSSGGSTTSDAQVGYLAVLLHSMGQLGLSPPPAPWQRRFWSAVARRLAARPGALSGARLCGLLAGAARLGMAPTGWLRDELLEAAAAAVEGGDPRSCARAAYCVAALGWRPGKRWVVRLLAASRPLLGAFAPRDLSNAAWALATMGASPDRRCVGARGR